jgi:hypothetical protein
MAPSGSRMPRLCIFVRWFRRLCRATSSQEYRLAEFRRDRRRLSHQVLLTGYTLASTLRRKLLRSSFRSSFRIVLYCTYAAAKDSRKSLGFYGSTVSAYRRESLVLAIGQLLGGSSRLPTNRLRRKIFVQRYVYGIGEEQDQ